MSGFFRGELGDKPGVSVLREEGEGGRIKKAPARRGWGVPTRGQGTCGRYWIRTNDLLRVKQALSPTELTAQSRDAGMLGQHPCGVWGYPL